jgi:hypothetical protein
VRARCLPALAWLHGSPAAHRPPPAPPARSQALLERQREEAAALEADYGREYAAFVDGWQARVAAARNKAAQQEAALRAKQAAELEALRLRHGMAPLRPKFSNHLLGLRAKAAVLARQREFEHAEQVKSRAQLLERAELALLRQEHEAKQAAEVEALAAQHQRELDALVRRLTGVRNDLLSAQQEELEVFSRRLQVRRSSRLPARPPDCPARPPCPPN